MIRGCIGGLLALSLLAGACSDDEPDTAAITSIPDETSSTTTTTEPETVAPDVIPDDESLITEDYVEAVLTGLAQASLDAFLATREAGVVEERAIALTTATSTEPESARGLNSLADVALTRFEGYRTNPGPIDYRVQRLTTARPECIVAVVTIDSSQLLEDPPPESSSALAVELLPATAEQRGSGLNPTAWVIDSLLLIDEEDADCEVTT